MEGNQAGLRSWGATRFALEFASGPPRPRLALHLDPKCSTRSPRTNRSRKGQGAVWASPRPRQARLPSLCSAAPRIPRLRPAPRLRRSAPSARPGPAVAAAECHGAIALPPPLCTMSGRSSASSPKGAGAAAFSWRRESQGRPAQGEGAGGRRGGGEVARTVCGRGGEPHSGSHRLLPAPASTFCTAQRRTCPPASPGPAADSTGEDAPRSWGPAPQSSPLPAARKQT